MMSYHLVKNGPEVLEENVFKEFIILYLVNQRTTKGHVKHVHSQLKFVHCD